jgi:hypothetical protein
MMWLFSPFLSDRSLKDFSAGIFVILLDRDVNCNDKGKMQRIEFITHKGRAIMYLNFSDCNVDEVLQLIETAKKIIRVQPLHSVLTLTNVSGTKFNREVVEAMKEFAEGNKPFVRAGAVIGIEGLKKIVYDTITRFTERNLPAFDEIEKAKDWLIDQ